MVGRGVAVSASRLEYAPDLDVEPFQRERIFTCAYGTVDDHIQRVTLRVLKGCFCS